jgi:hypothetical protein
MSQMWNARNLREFTALMIGASLAQRRLNYYRRRILVNLQRTQA